LLLVPTLLRWNAFSGVLRPVILNFPADVRQISFTKPVMPIDIWGLLTLLPGVMYFLFGEVWQSSFEQIRNPKLCCPYFRLF